VIHRYRRLWLLAGVLAGVLLAPGAALAADEPSPEVIVDEPNLVNETTLTVRFVDVVTLLPVDGADVHVVARQLDVVLGEHDAQTDADGVAILEELPFEAGFAPEVVHLDVIATKETSFTDPETGCTLADSWRAERLGIEVVDREVEVDFTGDEQSPSSSLACPPEQPAPTQEVGGIQGTPAPKHTLPPTDALAGPAQGHGDGLAVAVALIAFGSAVLFATPRRRLSAVRARRGDRPRR
jgi:hypothetical protein